MEFVKHDLDFILQQILISEAHAAGGDLLTLVTSPLLPYGLRTVDGSYNNIVPGQEFFGAADQPMPNRLPQVFRDAGTVTFDPDGPGGQAVGDPTTYLQTSGFVFDSQPRTISHLISDQTLTNPAAVAVAGPGAVPGAEGTLFIANESPDVGLSAPFNSWFTIFGQFFDHGLDLIDKGGRGTVIIPLQPDDPLIAGNDGILVDDPLTLVDEAADNLPAQLRFMALTRASYEINPITGEREFNNSTTPFVDQNQTYTSHPSHQVFLRAYELNDAGRPVSSGKMLDGAIDGSIGNWAEVKAQALMLGIQLTDADVGDVPLILTDAYGRFIPGADGYAQVAFPTATPGVFTYQSGTPAAPLDITAAVRTGHAFLNDIAHNAAPGTFNHDGNPATPPIAKTADLDSDVSTVVGAQPFGTYDNELLDLHYVTGDGRGNENIALTAVHSVFHSEHNRMVDHIKDVVLASGNVAYVNQWLDPSPLNQITAIPTAAADIAALDWNGERLFQAARFGTEMQYQHFVFEEFARKIQPAIDIFAGFESTVDPAIMSEFANVVYRFGHSMLTDTVDRINPDNPLDTNPIGLIEAFLNPLEFAASGATTADAIGEIVTGMTRQVGNHIDEFITESLHNNLLGLPMDLGVLNLARGRDTGIPGLNAARRMFFADTANTILEPYESWVDFGLGIKNPESLVNFVAAYGTHASITGATTMADKRLAATALVNGTHADSFDFMNSTGAFANTLDGITTSGVDGIDFWIGGLAEQISPFGGMLGATFNYVFQTQMTMLQNNDRLYYLARLPGLNVLTQLEQGSMAELVMRNSTAKHLPGDIFSTPTYLFEAANLGLSGAILNDPGTVYDESLLLTRAANGTIRYSGEDHIMMGGTAGNDRLMAGLGDDTLHGDEGNDRLEGGAGNDFIFAGAGDDILLDSFGDDNLKAGDGHDVISNGSGIDLLFGGNGNDFILGGDGLAESFGGLGNDFIYAGTSDNTVFGDAGDDWIEGGSGADLLQGDNGDPFQQSAVLGHDVIMGDGNDDYDSESGDDIMFGSPGVNRAEGMLGFDWVTYARSPELVDADLTRTALLPPDLDNIRDRFDLVEGLSGWNGNDLLKGSNALAINMLGHELDAAGIARIGGLQAVLGGAAVTSFTGGDILLGGGGADIIEGRAGDDVIDGDAWLNARISVRSLADPTVQIDSANNMAALQVRMLNGTINPNQLVIVREILSSASAGDVAVFTGARADYTIGAVQADGSRLVTDNVGTDGTDRIRNIEILRFSDGDLILGGGNSVATGEPTITDTTPTEGSATTVLTNTLADTNGLGAFSFQWQASADGTTWVDVAGANAAAFTPAQAQVGQLLRVTVSFTDGLGNLESLTSAPTSVVGDLFAGTVGADVFNGTAGADNASGAAGADTLNGLAGNDILNGGGGSDTLNGGTGADTMNGGGGNDILDGGTGADSMIGGGGNDTFVVDDAGDVVVEAGGGGTDTVQVQSLLNAFTLAANLENLVIIGANSFTGTGNAAGNTMTGGTGADTLSGLGGNDALNGGDGNDALLGGTGNDNLLGGAGADTLTGGTGADLFRYTDVNQSNDVLRDLIIDFGATDDIHLGAIDANAGTAANNTFVFIGTAAFGANATAQVRYSFVGGNTLVEASNDADAIAEFSVLLQGNLNLVAGQFVL